MATRKELIKATGVRYRASGTKEKTKILEEFVALTGFHRKHAIRVLNRESKPKAKQNRHRIYDEAVLQALRIVWEAADRVCGKRLKAAMPLFIESMEQHGHIELDVSVRERLLRMSAASIDRLLEPTRRTALGERRRRGGVNSTLRKSIPIRTFADWQDVTPGFFQIDFVEHCGGRAEGSFVHSLVLTDVASAWTECVSLAARDQSLVVAGFEKVRKTLPFPMQGFNSDNDSAFINQTVVNYARENGLTFTRSRPYRKNDQAWVEQKNGSVARRFVGYGRLEGLAATAALAKLYEAARLYVNFFQPSMKLKSKTREGSHVMKRYFAPITPCERLLASGCLDDVSATKLRAERAQLDPVALLQAIRTAQEVVTAFVVTGAPIEALPTDDTAAFMQGLARAWQDGEVRPTHRPKTTTPHHWRTRPDPFEHSWSTIENWLENEPGITAKALMERLSTMMPDIYTTKAQLRTLQRRVKAWRSKQARELIFAALKREPVTSLSKVSSLQN